MANKLELAVEVDSSGAIRSLQIVQDSLKRVGDETKKASDAGSSFSKFADQVKAGLSDPLNAAGGAAKSLLAAVGPVGAGVAAVGAALAAVGAAGYSAAKSLGEYGDRLEDTASRLGLTVRQTAQLSFAMKAAGGDIASIEGVMRKLSQGLADGSEEGAKSAKAMADMGIATRDANGNLRPTLEIITQLSKEFAKLPEGPQRNAAAIKALGRAALEVLPDLMDVPKYLERAEKVGIVGPSEATRQNMKEYLELTAEVDQKWEALKRRSLTPLAWTFLVTYKFLSEGKPPAVPGMAGTYSAGGPAGTFDTGVHGLAFAYDPSKPMSQQYLSNLYNVNIPGGMSSSILNQRLPGAPAAGLIGSPNFASLINTGGNDLASAQRSLAQLKEAYDKARQASEQQKLSGVATADTAQRLNEQLRKARTEYEAQERIVKSITQAESEREQRAKRIVEMLEKYKAIGQTTLAKFQVEAAKDLGNVNPEDRDRLRAAQGTAFTRELLKGLNETIKKNVEEAYRESQEIRALFDSVRDGLTFAPTIIGRAVGFSPQYRSTDQILSEYRANAQFQERFAELTAGPGGEAAAATKIAAIRTSMATFELQAARQKAQLLVDEQERATALFNAQVDYEDQLNSIRRDNATRLLELRKQQEDDYVNTVKGGFQALLAGGAGGLESFAKSQLAGFATTVVGNVARLSYQPGRFSLPGVGTAENPTTLGRLLAGTPFGADPAATLQVSAANIQMTAASTFAAAVGSFSAGGAVAGGGSLASNLPFSNFSAALAPYSAASATSRFMTAAFSPNLRAFVPGDYSIRTGDGTATTLSSLGAAGRLGAIAGTGAVILGGIAGTMSGIKQGGLRGGLTASASILGTAAALDPEPISKAVLAIAALTAGGITMLLGDPKQKYDQRESAMLKAAYYNGPEASAYSFDVSGKAYDYDMRGGARTYNVNISAVDAKGVANLFNDHGDVMANGVRQLVDAHMPLRQAVQSAVIPI